MPELDLGFFADFPYSDFFWIIDGSIAIV